MNDNKEKHVGRLIWRILMALVVLLLLAAVVLRLLKPKDAVVTTPLPTVSVEQAQTADIEIETSLVGTIETGDVYYVMPKVAGEIREIFVQQGDRIEVGAPIARIDNEKQIDAAKISLDSARVQVQTATDSLQTARTNLDRMQALLATGDISTQAYEQTKSGYDQASAAVDAAKLQLDAAQLQYDTQVEFATVTAPVSGTVESENMDLNAMASQSSQLCVITSEGAKKVRFSVTDRLLSALSIGDSVRVEKQGSTYEGSISEIETMPNAQTGLYPVVATIAGDGALTTGASVKVYFVSERADGVKAVDTDAVYYDGGKTYVYTITYNDENSVVQEGETDVSSEAAASAEASANEAVTISPNNRAATIHKVEVETGISSDGLTEIRSGIKESDKVVLTWTAQLYEGAQVQVLPEEALS